MAARNAITYVALTLAVAIAVYRYTQDAWPIAVEVEQ